VGEVKRSVPNLPLFVGRQKGAEAIADFGVRIAEWGEGGRRLRVLPARDRNSKFEMWNWKWFACLRQDFEKRTEESGKGRERKAIAERIKLQD